MKRLWDAVRSVILWVLSVLHFFIATPALVLLAIFLNPRKHDWLQRASLPPYRIFLGSPRRGAACAGL